MHPLPRLCRQLRSSAATTMAGDARLRSKVVVRNLPPSLTEEAFSRMTAPHAASIDYLSFRQGVVPPLFSQKALRGGHAVLSFTEGAALLAFVESITAAIRDADGGPAMPSGGGCGLSVEFSPFQSTPPHKGLAGCTNPAEATIDADEDYCAFTRELAACEARRATAQPPSSEQLLSAIASEKAPPKDSSTPLLRYLQNLKIATKKGASSAAAADKGTKKGGPSKPAAIKKDPAPLLASTAAAALPRQKGPQLPEGAPGAPKKAAAKERTALRGEAKMVQDAPRPAPSPAAKEDDSPLGASKVFFIDRTKRPTPPDQARRIDLPRARPSGPPAKAAATRDEAAKGDPAKSSAAGGTGSTMGKVIAHESIAKRQAHDGKKERPAAKKADDVKLKILSRPPLSACTAEVAGEQLPFGGAGGEAMAADKKTSRVEGLRWESSSQDDDRRAPQGAQLASSVGASRDAAPKPPPAGEQRSSPDRAVIVKTGDAEERERLKAERKAAKRREQKAKQREEKSRPTVPMQEPPPADAQEAIPEGLEPNLTGGGDAKAVGKNHAKNQKRRLAKREAKEEALQGGRGDGAAPAATPMQRPKKKDPAIKGAKEAAAVEAKVVAATALPEAQPPTPPRHEAADGPAVAQ